MPPINPSKNYHRLKRILKRKLLTITLKCSTIASVLRLTSTASCFPGGTIGMEIRNISGRVETVAPSTSASAEWKIIASKTQLFVTVTRVYQNPLQIRVSAI